MEKYVFLDKDNFKFPENQINKLANYINGFDFTNINDTLRTDEKRLEFIKYVWAFDTYFDLDPNLVKNLITDSNKKYVSNLLNGQLLTNKFSNTRYFTQYIVKSDDNSDMQIVYHILKLNDINAILINKNYSNKNYYYYLLLDEVIDKNNDDIIKYSNVPLGSNNIIALSYRKSTAEKIYKIYNFNFHFGFYNLFLDTYSEDDVLNDFYIFNQETVDIKTPNKLKRKDGDIKFKPLPEIRQIAKKIIYTPIKYKKLPTEYCNLFSYKYYIWSLLNDNIEENSPDDILGYILPETVTMPTDFSTGFDQQARQTGMYFLNPDKITVQNIDSTKTQILDNIGIIADTNNNYFIFIHDDFNNEKILESIKIEFNSHNILTELYKNFINMGIQIPTSYNKLFIYNFGYNIFSFLSSFGLSDDTNKLFIYNEGVLSIEKANSISQLDRFTNVKSINILQDPIVNKKIKLNKNIFSIKIHEIYNPDKIDKKFINNPSLIHTVYGYDMLIKK